MNPTYNYIKLIKRFWQEVETDDFLPSEACVYFRLVEICNRSGWQNPFSLSNSRAVALMAMNEKTFRAIRDKLAERGLIDFRKGKRRESKPMYCIPVEVDDVWVFPWENFLEVKNTANTPVNTTVNTTANTPAYNKTKTKTNISPNGDCAAVPAPVPELSLFAEEDRKKKKAKAAKDPPPPFPTLEEVLQYFLSQDADKRLENWEESARSFFDNFTAVDWRDKYNRRITRWDSRANKWILDDEQRQKERSKPNENRQSDRFSERRGTEPESKSRKGFKGTL